MNGESTKYEVCRGNSGNNIRSNRLGLDKKEGVCWGVLDATSSGSRSDPSVSRC